MQDLDIRGAGNLLGAEQSGFIADLGYETYQKILNQAMKELNFEMRNEELEMSHRRSRFYKEHSSTKRNENDEMKNDSLSSTVETTVDTDLALYFPDQYVPSDSERMLLYRELDNLHTDEQLAAYRSRLIDRFGTCTAGG